ncbi:class I SAM-dependent methyltransferase [Lysinibacillus sp. 2017]|uniref:class I SAM-dependent methyltransferase n=1 Tax=unclassified Lysinibacillus TaxID=2636778 RepID=UPI000D527E9D|nr:MULTISPECIES: class I SAM-dependent methyltransferase [unclassified Lysinibacillus]AWE06397.1 class I SAM-dependent methyltransferase [Lysinibacillus sp. 2017]TGN33403.1 class I SAM-dependent methyltransferase [Lysinibacillus sp. S2017]
MAWNEVWEEIFKEKEWGKYPPEELVRFVARNFYSAPNRRDIKILELGCGPGANVWYISREGFTVYGIEGSATAVKRANLRLNEEVIGWSGEIIQGDFSQLPYEGDFFDAVIDNEAIYVNSFEDSKKIFSEVHRVLKPNGKVFSKTFATGSWGDQTGTNVGYNEWIVAEGPLKGTGNCRFSSEEDIQELLLGFKLEGIEYQKVSYGNLEHEVKEWIVVAKKEV